MSEFDEKSAEIEADNWWAKTHTSHDNSEYVERAFIEGARYQHSLMQERLAAAEQSRVSTNNAMNRALTDKNDAVKSHDILARTMQDRLAEYAQLTATCERLEAEIRLWQDTFDIEMNLAEHQRNRYNMTAQDAAMVFKQRRMLRDKDLRK